MSTSDDARITSVLAYTGLSPISDPGDPHYVAVVELLRQHPNWSAHRIADEFLVMLGAKQPWEPRRP